MSHEFFTIELDWEAYYESFKQLHGLDPVNDEHGDYLLFPDGWRYSAHRPNGPEYPPESKRDAYLIGRQYWRIRKQIVRGEIQTLKSKYDNLKELSGENGRLSATLYSRVYIEDDVTGEPVATSQAINEEFFSLMEGRLEWLGKDLIDCERELTRLAKLLDE